MSVPQFPYLQGGGYRVVQRVKQVNRAKQLEPWLVGRRNLPPLVTVTIASKMKGTQTDVSPCADSSVTAVCLTLNGCGYSYSFRTEG